LRDVCDGQGEQTGFMCELLRFVSILWSKCNAMSDASAGCLRDVCDGQGEQTRSVCESLWLLSIPWSMLCDEQWQWSAPWEVFAADRMNTFACSCVECYHFVK